MCGGHSASGVGLSGGAEPSVSSAAGGVPKGVLPLLCVLPMHPSTPARSLRKSRILCNTFMIDSNFKRLLICVLEKRRQLACNMLFIPNRHPLSRQELKVGFLVDRRVVGARIVERSHHRRDTHKFLNLFVAAAHVASLLGLGHKCRNLIGSGCRRLFGCWWLLLLLFSVCLSRELLFRLGWG